MGLCLFSKLGFSFWKIWFGLVERHIWQNSDLQTWQLHLLDLHFEHFPFYSTHHTQFLRSIDSSFFLFSFYFRDVMLGETLLLLNKKQNTVNSCFLSIGFLYIYIYTHTHTHTMTRTFMDLAQKLKLVIRMMELIH